MEEFTKTIKNIFHDDILLILFAYWDKNHHRTFYNLCEKGDVSSLLKFMNVASLRKQDPKIFACACASGSKRIVKKLIDEGYEIDPKKLKKGFDLETKILNKPSFEFISYISTRFNITSQLPKIFSKAIALNDFQLAEFCLDKDRDKRINCDVIRYFVTFKSLEGLKWSVEQSLKHGIKLIKFKHEYWRGLPDEILFFLLENDLFDLSFLKLLYSEACCYFKFDLLSYLLQHYPYLADETSVISNAFDIEKIKLLVRIGANFQKADLIKYADTFYSQGGILLLRYIPPEMYTPSKKSIMDVFSFCTWNYRKDYKNNRINVVFEMGYDIPCEALRFLTENTELFLETLSKIKQLNSSALEAAAKTNNILIVKAVLERGVKPDENIVSACSVAVEKNNLELIEFLLSLPVDLTIHIDSLIKYAKTKEVLQILEKKGANIKLHRWMITDPKLRFPETFF